MTKSKIILEIRQQILSSDTFIDEKCVTKQVILSVLDSFFDICKQTVVAGEQVELRGFGTFLRQTLKSRKIVIPRTDTKIKIGKRARPVFKPGADFKKQVNDNFEC